MRRRAIRGGANRRVLERIKETGDIFFARSDDPWILSGPPSTSASSARTTASETDRELDGQPVPIDQRQPDDRASTSREPAGCRRTAGIAFMGDTKGGPFDIDAETARRLLGSAEPRRAIERDVVRPWVNGLDITRRPRGMWIIDFGVDMPEAEAALYEAPFEYVREHVQPDRVRQSRERYASAWWLHVEPRPEHAQGPRRHSGATSPPR